MFNWLSRLLGSTASKRAEALPMTPDLIQEFENLKKPCIAITAKPVSMDQIAAGESRFGGIPDIPPTYKWPTYNDGKHLPFIAQINFRETSAFDSEDLLPKMGQLLIFYEGGENCWGFRADDHKFWKIEFFDSDIPLTRRELPPDIPDWIRIKPGKLEFRSSDSRPDFLDFATISFSPEKRNSYIDYLESLNLPVATHQMLGHSRNVQNDMRLECQLTSNGIDCGGPEGYSDPRRKELEPGSADWMLLLQFDTDDDLGIMWGDVGTIYVWIRKQDLAAKRFDKARICFQCC